MKGMMLHCGAKAMDRTQLGMLPVPEPMGKRHYIRPFIDEVQDVTELLGEHGMRLKDESYGVKIKDGYPTQFFGLMELDFSELGDTDYALTIGLRGSYNQTLPRGLVVGSNVFVCDNLCFSGEVTMKTKQTININSRIRELLYDAVAQIPDLAYHQHSRFNRYKEVDVGKHGVDSAIIDLVRVGTLNPSQVGKVIEEWDVPKHPEHAQYGHSVWRFHNAVTEALKPADNDRPHVMTAMNRTLPLTEMCDKLAA